MVADNNCPGAGGDGNVDPLFVDAANGNLRLQPTSPAINMGNDAVVPADTKDVDDDGDTAEKTPDLDLNDRIFGAMVDMGAFEVQTVSLIIIKYQDLDRDGTENEVSNSLVTGNTLAGWEFSIYDSDGFLASGTTFEEDAANDLGVRVTFSNLDLTKTYTICETPQGNWANSDPGANGVADPGGLGRACKTIDANTITPGSSTNVFFGNVRYGRIMVTKYEDLNTNGQRDNGEPGLEGWQIELRDINDNLIASTTTGMDGTASFSDVPPGNYKICEVLQFGWGNTDPGDGTLCKTVANFELGENREVAFGNVQCNLTVEAGDDQTICLTKTATLAGANFGGLATSATWSIISEPETGAGTLSETGATTSPETVTFSATKPGTYVLQLTTDSPFGCDPVSDTVTIEVLNVNCGQFPWRGNE